MDELHWNFLDSKRLYVFFINSGKEIIISGELLSNGVFLVSSSNFVNCENFTSQELEHMKSRLTYLTRNDKVRIIFE
jgi:hypothetical protein